MRKEIIAKMKTNWLNFINDKDNKPYLDETYGTKYPGNVLFEHYILWALLRGKDPSSCSHNPSSDRYLRALASSKRALIAKPSENFLISTFLGDSVTKEELANLVS